MKNFDWSLAALGLASSHLVDSGYEKMLLDERAAEAFAQLRNDAAREGFNIAIASAWRGFERQSQIWNAKARGERPLLDLNGNTLSFAFTQFPPLELQNQEQLLWTILFWSALPGTSRHHWGTDIDIYDANCIDSVESVQLTNQECEGTGPFTPLHHWLDERIRKRQSYGFIRPYQKGTGSVQPERWHLSHMPSAQLYAKNWTIVALQLHLQQNPLALHQVILAQLPTIAKLYVEPYLRLTIPR